jgi:hypothetical protein
VGAQIIGGMRLDEAEKHEMGLSLYKTPHDVVFHEERHEVLKRYRSELMRVRLQLAELKRTGSQEGLAALTSDAASLSMRIKRFEIIMRCR